MAAVERRPPLAADPGPLALPEGEWFLLVVEETADAERVSYQIGIGDVTTKFDQPRAATGGIGSLVLDTYRNTATTGYCRVYYDDVVVIRQ